MKKSTDFNASISTFVTDRTAERLFQLYFLKPEQSDVSFRVVDEDSEEKKASVFVAHKTIVTARCEVLCRMLTNDMFAEAKMESPIINGSEKLFLFCFLSLIENRDDSGRVQGSLVLFIHRAYSGLREKKRVVLVLIFFFFFFFFEGRR
jgi:hypothetical protein